MSETLTTECKMRGWELAVYLRQVSPGVFLSQEVVFIKPSFRDNEKFIY